MSEHPTCIDCGHFFDPEDERGRVYDDFAKCPLCFVLSHETSTAFAVWNGCQGIFAETTRGFYDEAEAVLNGEMAGVGTCVAPVLVMAAPEDELYRFRLFDKTSRIIGTAEREKLWRAECALPRS